MAPSLESYDRRRREETLWRLCLVAVCSLLPIGLGAVVDLQVQSVRMSERMASFGAMAASALLALACAHAPWAPRWAIVLAVGYVGAVGTSALYLIALSPQNLDVTVGALAATMIATALILPWGGGAQALVSGLLALAYLPLAPWAAWETTRAANVLFILADGAVLSLVGAVVLDRQRRATWAEREQARALAQQRELLLEAARELNTTLDSGELCTRIVQLGRRLVASDTVTLTLLDERRDVLRMVAVDGAASAAGAEMLDLEFPAEGAAYFIEALERAPVIGVPGSGPLDFLGPAIADHFGVRRLLLIAIRRDGRFLGYLSFNYQTPGPRFPEEQLRLAEGLAEQAAIALTNARLVEDLRRANQVKSEFVSTMSHELRTPLNVIIGYADLLDVIENDERDRAAERIRVASRELLELIEATLNLGRLESGQDPPRIEPVSLRELWEELRTEFDALPRADGVTLRWQAGGDVVPPTDRRKLRTIVKNLVGNALKFTPTGEVVASYRVGPARCVLAVRDTGIGIAPEALPHIFEMFRQVDSSDARSYGGVGLGLHIVHRLVTQLGGTVNVESAPGQGSSFVVTLPLHAAAHGSPAAAA